MKKITLISAIALSGLFYSTANAQILQIGLHLGGGRPVVQTSVISPNVAVSYTNADNYYYLPDVDAYYNTYEQAYYYNDGERWVSAAYLPGEYRNYDWRNARHYELRARRPYLNDDVYRERYRGNADWNRNNDRVDNRSYANRDERRNEEPRFERHSDNYRGAEHADNRGWDNGNRRDDNSGRGNYNQSQPSRGQGSYGQQGRWQGGYQQEQRQQSQPSQQGRGQWQYQQAQPSRQYGNGQQQRDGNSNEHFADNHAQNGHDRFRF
jgi:hypothetical protein